MDHGGRPQWEATAGQPRWAAAVDGRIGRPRPAAALSGRFLRFGGGVDARPVHEGGAGVQDAADVTQREGPDASEVRHLGRFRESLGSAQ